MGRYGGGDRGWLPSPSASSTTPSLVPSSARCSSGDTSGQAMEGVLCMSVVRRKGAISANFFGSCSASARPASRMTGVEMRASAAAFLLYEQRGGTVFTGELNEGQAQGGRLRADCGQIAGRLRADCGQRGAGAASPRIGLGQNSCPYALRKRPARWRRRWARRSVTETRGADTSAPGRRRATARRTGLQHRAHPDPPLRPPFRDAARGALRQPTLVAPAP